MNQIMYHTALAVHITALTLMAGTTLLDYVTFRQFWKRYAVSKPEAMAIRYAMSKFPGLIRIGIILLILSGITMMGLTHGIFGEQIWFRIKIVLVLIVIVNGLAVGRRLGMKLGKTLAEDAEGKDVSLNLLMLKNNIRIFHVFQLAIFLLIFTLSVFKFN